jgi:predicted DNA binding CopG/RHH family protein
LSDAAALPVDPPPPCVKLAPQRPTTRATFRKDRRLNTRLSSKDLEAIQKQALAEGLPYQTLIASLLHKYATGRLKEI